MNMMHDVSPVSDVIYPQKVGHQQIPIGSDVTGTALRLA